MLVTPDQLDVYLPVAGAVAMSFAIPSTMTLVGQVLHAEGRGRPLVHVPLPLVRASLRAVELIAGSAAFATWEEAELMEVPMTTERGTADAETLGVEPRPMDDVLGR